MFLYRDFYYNREKTDKKNEAELIIAKHRNGETGKMIYSGYLNAHQEFGDTLGKKDKHLAQQEPPQRL